MRFLLPAALCCAALGAVAAPLPSHTLKADEAPPRIDGRLDEAVWQAAPVFDTFTRLRPDSAPDAGPYRKLAFMKRQIRFGIVHIAPHKSIRTGIRHDLAERAVPGKLNGNAFLVFQVA